MLPAGAAKRELYTLAAAAAEVRDYRADLLFEHFKELVETAPRPEELLHSIMRAIECGNFFHQRSWIREKSYVQDEIGIGGPRLEGKG